MAVALSGGPDSLALILLAHDVAQQENIALHAFTVDHRLRPESGAEAAALQARMQSLGIPHRTLVWVHAAVEGNLPAAARQARYALLTEACRAERIPILLLGHHGDDQAETLLHQLLRGSGVDGLSAMPRARMQEGIALLRPLLSFPKSALQDYCAARGGAWFEDPSNDDPRFARTLLRRLLAEFSGSGLSAARLSETAAHMARARAALEWMTEALLAQGTAQNQGLAQNEGFLLPLDAWRQAPEEIRLRALRQLATRMGDAEPPRFEALARLAEVLMQQAQGAQSLHHLRWVWREGSLSVQADSAATALQPHKTRPI